VEVGEAPRVGVGRGECVEVATGAPIPPGANAVVKFEGSSIRDGLVEVMKSVAEWENVARRGEDLKAGALILRRGDRVRPWHVAALASQGIRRILAYSPLVSVISTGDELVEPGDELEPGKTYSYTKSLVKAWLRENGCDVLDGGIVPDDEFCILESLERALEMADAAVITGGTSVGRRDYTVRAIKKLEGLRLLIHGIAMRPGMPTALSVVRGKVVLAVSGLPVAALAALELIFKPLLGRMVGNRLQPLKLVARLRRKVTGEPGFLDFVRVRVLRGERGFEAVPIRARGSGSISSLLEANGVLLVPEDVEGFEKGAAVEVIMYGEAEDLSQARNS
ncbi:MAG: molybdopterin molybdenumtransferase MoeA, partial [Thermoprotei archaeon]